MWSLVGFGKRVAALCRWRGWGGSGIQGEVGLTRQEALLVIILVGYYFHHESFDAVGSFVAEGLSEVKLLRKIAREIPELDSYVDASLRGE